MFQPPGVSEHPQTAVQAGPCGEMWTSEQASAQTGKI